MNYLFFILLLIPLNIFAGSVNEEELFLSDNPGYSEFFYYWHGEKYVTRTDQSVSSHWTPSEEQLQNMRTVIHTGSIRVGIGTIVYDTLIISGSEEYVQIPGRYVTGKVFTGYPKGSSWTAVGNRWIDVGSGLYVDLDAALVIHTAGRHISSVHPIERTW